MATAPSKVQSASGRSKESLSFHANTQPTHTGTIAAGRVFGLAAKTQDLREKTVTRAVETNPARQTISNICGFSLIARRESPLSVRKNGPTDSLGGKPINLEAHQPDRLSCRDSFRKAPDVPIFRGMFFRHKIQEKRRLNRKGAKAAKGREVGLMKFR